MPLTASAQVQASFSQSSDPPGIFSSSSSQVFTGTLVATVAAPLSASGYQFSHWTLNGVRHQDALGRSMNPAIFVLVEPTTAVARYLVSTTDSVGDGIPDWFRWMFYGSTNAAAALDSDGDGFTLAEEFARDTHPRLPDGMIDGGVSARGSASVIVVLDTNVVLYTATSTPPGVVNQNQAIAIGTLVVLSDVNGLQAGYQFAQWLVNGERVADVLGRSVGGLRIEISSNTTAVAQFVSPTADSNADGVPDWFELQFYGTTSQSAGLDSDGDGFTLVDEFARDTHPLVPDTMQDGGISQRAGASVAIFNPNYATYTVVSTPPGLVTRQDVLLTNATVLLPDVNGLQGGYQFAQWVVNGTRVADVLGRSVGNLGFVLGSNSTAVAQFLLPGTDSAGDGVADWFKLHFHGDTNIAASADTDGDGFTLADEFQRDTHPNIPDTIHDGGISQRASGEVFVDLSSIAFYRLSSVPVGLVDESGFVPVNTVIVTPDLAGGTNGYLFGHWQLNGIRQQGTGPQPLTQLTFELGGNIFATAIFHSPSADSDGDGLPDWWEDYHLGHPTFGQPGMDADSDGLNNLFEYLAGTNPNLASSNLRLTSVEFDQDGFVLRFQSVSNKLYQLETAESLGGSNSWEVTVDNILGSGDWIELVDTNAVNATQRFYRIKVKQ